MSLNNHSMVNASKKDFQYFAGNPGKLQPEAVGKWRHFLNRGLHLFKRFYKIFALSKMARAWDQQLDEIQSRILDSELNKTSTVTALLRELMVAKKKFKPLILKKEVQSLQERSNELKQYLITTSHQVVHSQKMGCSGNSHQYVLKRMNQEKREEVFKFTPAISLPKHVYWQHGQEQSALKGYGRYFQTPNQYKNFKKLLDANQEAELLKLKDHSESQEQATTYNPSITKSKDIF